MTEDDDIRLREPASQAGGATGRRAAVVNGRDLASIETDHESLGQNHAAIVVAEDRPNRASGPSSAATTETPNRDSQVDAVAEEMRR